MADDADITTARQEREEVLLRRASVKPEGPTATGFCLWCEESLETEGQRWCSPECHQDHEYYVGQRRRAGEMR